MLTIFLLADLAAAAAPRRKPAAKPRFSNPGSTVESTVPRVSAAPPTTNPAPLIYVGTESTSQMMDRQSRRRSPATRPSKPHPERPYPKRDDLPQNPDSPATGAFGNGMAMSAESVRFLPTTDAPPILAQTSGISFTGATLAGTNPTGAFPPDSMGAVGPTQYVVAVNGRIVTFNKATGVEDGQMNVDTDTFFAPALTPPPTADAFTFTSDPRVRYDRLTGRWFLVMIDVTCVDLFCSDTTTPNRVMITWTDATSDGKISGSTQWTKTFFLAMPHSLGGASCFADYPMLGIDNKALYIGTMDFCPTLFSGTSGYVVPKAPILAGNAMVFAFVLEPGDAQPGLYGPQGVDNFDPTANEGYFIGVDGASFGKLQVRRVSDPGGTPTMSGNISITVPTTRYPHDVPHLNNDGSNVAPTSRLLDAIDDRLYAAHIRNGRLWSAHNILVDTNGVAIATPSLTLGRNGVRWYELGGIRSTDGVPTVMQSGTIFDNAATDPRFFWFPSVMISGQGHAAFGFSAAGVNNFVDAGTAGRWLGDALGTQHAVSFYTSSSFAYNPPDDSGSPRRWGDYSYTSLDPLDDMTMWTIQEFADAANSYGVRAVQLIAPSPATPVLATPALLGAGVTSTFVTVTASSINGTGFFDPGADLAPPALAFHHLSANATAGVVVNSASYVNPTTVILDLNTQNATAGPVDVTITNPDGQSATGSALLTISSIAAPTGVVATATSASTVSVTWNQVPGAAGYEVQRSVNGGVFTSAGTTGSQTATTFNDNSGLIGDKTYLYVVRVMNSPTQFGPLSTLDLATTKIFTDDPAAGGSTFVSKQQFDEARIAVNAVREAAALPLFSFTDSSLTNVVVKSVHVTQLLAALNEALTTLHLATVVPVHTAAPSAAIVASDLNEIRNATK